MSYAARAGFVPARETTVNALLIGISARANRSGFRNDGSFRYGSEIATAERSLADSMTAGERQKAFDQASAADLIDRGAGAGRYLAEDNVRIFEDIVRETESTGIQLIVFVVPVSPTAHAYLSASPDMPSYLPLFSAAIGGLSKRHNVPFFDMLDGRPLGAGDEDFYDWLHPSERLMARFVTRMFADPRAREMLAAYGDVRSVESDLARSSRRWQLYDF